MASRQSNTYSITTTVASAAFIPEQKGRMMLEIRNQGAENVHFRFGSEAATVANGYRLAPGESYVAPIAGHISIKEATHVGAVQIIAAANTSAVVANVDWIG